MYVDDLEILTSSRPAQVFTFQPPTYAMLPAAANLRGISCSFLE